ncbi:hypothetical protein ANCDUO_08878 [Ancylostoma duodenale]|uniref:Sulfotransferase domain-containing protein n=1 Tax=Ancylostoma duodenale TaxID=51022 RepID=A0A0C2GP78_9BILA|nr:hypothetical protein ANCDUO_08878 [Ancylostoma duodenale]
MTSFCSTAPSDLPQKKFPSAIIVGVKKAGTRALLEFLRLNPNIRAPGPEVHFFDKNYHKGLDWYSFVLVVRFFVDVWFSHGVMAYRYNDR